MNDLEIKIRFDGLVSLTKPTPILTVTNVRSKKDLEIVEAVLATVKDKTEKKTPIPPFSTKAYCAEARAKLRKGYL